MSKIKYYRYYLIEMPLINFTEKLKILLGRTTYADNIVQQKEVNNGQKIFVHSYPSIHDFSKRINSAIGMVNTTPEEAAHYIQGLSVKTVPSAPEIVSVIAMDASVSILFTNSSDGGSAIINFAYSYTLNGTYIEFPPNNELNLTLTELTNGQSYSVYLKAINSIGSSDPSLPATFIPATIPSAPSDLVSTPGDGQITVSFTASADNGGSIITKYQYYIDNDEIFTDIVTSPTSFTVTGLTNGQSYNIGVRAVNDVGSSSTSSITSTPATVPSAPTGLSATAGNTQISVSFTAGANGGSLISNYEYSIDGGSSYSEFSPADVTSPVVITGLINGLSYNIKLRAVNVAGPGVASAMVSSTPMTVPSAPTGLSATAGDGQTSITFTTGSNGGSTITNYKYSINGGSSYTAFSPIDITSPVVITGLSNGTSYNIKLRAVNMVGDGAQSAVVTVTPAAPGPSGTVAFDPGNVACYSGTGNTLSSIGTGSALSGTMADVSYSASNGGYLGFNGSSSYISFPTYNFGNAFTLIAWVNPIEQTNINTLFATASANQETAGIKLGWNQWIANNKEMYYEGGNGNAGNASVSPSGTMAMDAWQHITYVFDQSNRTISFYKNGVLLTDDNIQPVANIPMNETWYIGSMFGSYWMKANVGLLTIYPNLVNTTDILADYNATKSRYGL